MVGVFIGDQAQETVQKGYNNNKDKLGQGQGQGHVTKKRTQLDL